MAHRLSLNVARLNKAGNFMGIIKKAAALVLISASVNALAFYAFSDSDEKVKKSVLPVVTVDNLVGCEVVEIKGMVSSKVAVFLTGSVKLEELQENISKEARDMGANAVVGVGMSRSSSSSFMYGTAVVVECGV